jgi:hypothetical protein
MQVDLSTCFYAYALDLLVELEVEEDTSSSIPTAAETMMSRPSPTLCGALGMTGMTW